MLLLALLAQLNLLPQIIPFVGPIQIPPPAPPTINATYVIVPIRCAVDPTVDLGTNLAACGFDPDLYLQLKAQMGDR